MRGDTAALDSAITAAQRDIGDLWRDRRGLQEAHNTALSTVERSVNELLQVAVTRSRGGPATGRCGDTHR